MPRYEFSEGSSNKFWEIDLVSKSFTTTYGKIGTKGQTTIKKFASDAEAKREYDKLVAEKIKKGYKLTGGKNAKRAPAKGTTADAAKRKAGTAAITSGTLDARNPSVEAAIVEDPFDRDAYAVFADWLQEQGDPRGELISLHLGYKDKQAKALLQKHADYFLGPLAEHQQLPIQERHQRGEGAVQEGHYRRAEEGVGRLGLLRFDLRVVESTSCASTQRGAP